MIIYDKDTDRIRNPSVCNYGCRPKSILERPPAPDSPCKECFDYLIRKIMRETLSKADVLDTIERLGKIQIDED